MISFRSDIIFNIVFEIKKMVNHSKTKLFGTMNPILVFVCFLLIVVPAAMCSGCQPPKQQQASGNCYMSKEQINASSTCLFNRQIVNCSTVNSREGLVECEFCLGLNSFTSYEFELSYVNGVSSEEQCTKSDDKLLHTRLTYTIGHNASLPPCQQTGKVHFKYVYTGCYVLRIFPKIDDSSRQPHTTVKFIRTEHIKQTYANHRPHVTSQYRTEDETVVLTVKDRLLFTDPSMNLILSPKSKYLKTGQKKYIMIPVLSRNKLVESCESYDKRTDKGSVDCDMQYMNDTGIAHCRIKNVPFGNYTAWIEFLSDPIRCRSSTVWGGQINICEWTVDIIPGTEVPVTLPTTTESSALEAQIGVSLLVVACILLLIFLVFVYRSRKRIMKLVNKTQLLSTRDSENDELRSLNKQKVILLYPFDCRAYMEFMVAFRNLLSQVGNCEVYDIHDESRDYEISQSPEEWVRDKLRQYKIILCLSPCAAVQRSMSIRSNSVYRQSRYTDGLFPYAIRFLTQNLGLQESYTRLFVVNLSFDTDPYETFSDFNPYTRYGLPDNCATLFTDLIDDGINVPLDQKSMQYQMLLSSYRTLQEYITQNPNYLKELLNVE